MKINILSMRNVAIAFSVVPLMLMISCQSNKGKLTGKLQVTEARLHSPEMDSAIFQIARMQDKEYSGSPMYHRLQNMLDSVRGLQNAMQETFKKCVYNLNSDGSFIINTDHGDVKGDWDVKKGKDFIYVVFNKEGKLFEQWQMYDDELTLPRFKEDHVLVAKINNGGTFENDGFYVDATFKKQE
jgi:hypothetical protein